MTTETTKQGEKRIGRPPQPVPQDKADEIINWISSGQTLREWCRQDGNPSFRAVYDWLEKDEDFASRFARAREIGQDVIAEEALAITDEPPDRILTEQGDKVDPGHVAWAKNRAELRLKLLAKWNPKKWGDRIDLTSKGDKVGLAINIDLGKEAQ